MAKARVPEVDTSGEGEVAGGGGGLVNMVEGIVRAATSVEEHASTTILHRKADIVKFDSHRVITSKTFNINKILNKRWRNYDIMKRNRPRIRRETGRTGVGDRKSFTVTDGDAGGSGGGRVNGEVTGVGGHMGGSIDVRDPISTATICACVGIRVEGV